MMPDTINDQATIELKANEATYSEEEVRRLMKIVSDAVLTELSWRLAEMADAVKGDYATGLYVASDIIDEDKEDLIQKDVDKVIKADKIINNID